MEKGGGARNLLLPPPAPGSRGQYHPHSAPPCLRMATRNPDARPRRAGAAGTRAHWAPPPRQLGFHCPAVPSLSVLNQYEGGAAGRGGPGGGGGGRREVGCGSRGRGGTARSGRAGARGSPRRHVARAPRGGGGPGWGVGPDPWRPDPSEAAGPRPLGPSSSSLRATGGFSPQSCLRPGRSAQGCASGR